MSRDASKTSPTIQEITEGLDRIHKSWMLIRNRRTGEKLYIRWSLEYFVGEKKKEWECDQIFTEEKEISRLEVLYGKKK